MQSPPSVRPSVCFHSNNFLNRVTFNLTFSTCMNHDHSSRGIEGQGRRSMPYFKSQDETSKRGRRDLDPQSRTVFLISCMARAGQCGTDSWSSVLQPQQQLLLAVRSGRGRPSQPLAVVVVRSRARLPWRQPQQPRSGRRSCNAGRRRVTATGIRGQLTD